MILNSWFPLLHQLNTATRILCFFISCKHRISKVNGKTFAPINVTNKILKVILVVVFSRCIRGVGHYRSSMKYFVSAWGHFCDIFPGIISWAELTNCQISSLNFRDHVLPSWSRINQYQATPPWEYGQSCIFMKHFTLTYWGARVHFCIYHLLMLHDFSHHRDEP